MPQLYIRPRVASTVTGKRLLAYRRVHLAARRIARRRVHGARESSRCSIAQDHWAIEPRHLRSDARHERAGRTHRHVRARELSARCSAQRRSLTTLTIRSRGVRQRRTHSGVDSYSARSRNDRDSSRAEGEESPHSKHVGYCTTLVTCVVGCCGRANDQHTRGISMNHFPRSILGAAIAAVLATPASPGRNPPTPRCAARRPPTRDVTAKNVATGATRRTQAGADGIYTLAGLPPGTYRSTRARAPKRRSR